ncbi:MAG: cytochrome bd ubiquinol oxidase subunit, partial [Caballeronia sp.]|nr:cytochrome bd ubiquinol oxidase subunit [Caballeronia sp.]
MTGTIRSLKEFAPQDLPPVPIVFFAFRVMVGLGLLMIAIGLASVVLRWRRAVYDARWLQYTMIAMSPAGFVAMLAGWTVTEVGRQPYTVFGILRTIDSASPVALPAVAWSAGCIGAAYVIAFSIGFFYLLRLVAKPPRAKEPGPHPTLAVRIRTICDRRMAGGHDVAAMIQSTGFLPLLAAGTLAFAVLMYVVLDGTDLGVGILFLTKPTTAQREMMVDSILPVWDGNETWLVLGGGGLIAMFPLAYAVFLSALYPVFFAMLLALIFRGMAIEFREHTDERRKPSCDAAMFAGSLLSAVCQGVLLGALIEGVHIARDQYAGGWLDWLTPFTVFCGIGLSIGYAWLGACWLMWRTEGALHRRARRVAVWLAVL